MSGASPAGPAPAPTVSAVAVPGIGEVTAGTDLAEAVVAACAAHGITLHDDDVVVIASKVVAKAEGRAVAARDRASAIAAETVRVVAQRTLADGRVTRVVQSRTGPVLAAAGVDASDVEHGTVLLLPRDPDGSARTIRAGIRSRTGAAPAVVVSDTAGRPWRDGVTDFALGAAGLTCLDDVRGRVDRFGRPLEVTVRAVGDEAAGLADLVRGKATGLPVAVVRGLSAHVSDDDGQGAAGCVRTGPTDWFAHGHVEAVRASLGVGPDDVPPPSIDPVAEPLQARVARAVDVATRGGLPAAADVVVTGARLDVTGEPVAAGVLAQRLVCALWAEGLVGEVVVDGTATATVAVRGPARAAGDRPGTVEH